MCAALDAERADERQEQAREHDHAPDGARDPVRVAGRLMMLAIAVLVLIGVVWTVVTGINVLRTSLANGFQLTDAVEAIVFLLVAVIAPGIGMSALSEARKR